MRKQRVINNSLQSEMLESGEVLAAAGTHGSVREDVTLSALDRARLVETGKVSVIEVEDETAPGPHSPDEAPDEPHARHRTRARNATDRPPAS